MFAQRAAERYYLSSTEGTSTKMLILPSVTVTLFWESVTEEG